MKKYIQMVVVLGVVGLVSALALVSMYQYAHPQIEANKKKVRDRAIYAVLPKAETYQMMVIGGREIYKGVDSQGHLIGYAFVSEGSGYQGEIQLMVGLNPDLRKVEGVEVLESVETPGLGARIREPSFKEQFKSLDASPTIGLVKGRLPESPNKIQAITGATISSSAVVEILNREIARIKAILKK